MMENWIVPCNIKVFNIIDHFKENKRAVWKNSFTIRKGDVVYIYVGAPYGEIKYKCIVTSDTVDEELLQKHSYAIVTKPSNNYFSKKIKYIEFELLQEFPEKALTLARLKEHGLGQVQIQARTDRSVQQFITMIEEQLISGEGGDA